MDMAVVTFTASPIIGLAVSGVYFAVSRDASRLARALSASHGLFLASAFAYAVTASHWSTTDTSSSFIWPFWLLLMGFVGSVAYSLFTFKGPGRIHVLQFVQMPCALLVWFVGSMMISHDWV